MMVKSIWTFLLLFVLLLKPFEEKAFQETEIIDIIGQMPIEASFPEAVKNFEKAFGSRMVPLNDSEDYAIYYLDKEDLTLFGYPVAVATHQNSTWDHCFVFFANDHEKAKYLEGGRGTFLSLPTEEFTAREVYSRDALQMIFDVYNGFGSSFGKLKAGGVMVFHDDGSGMKKWLLSLPLSESDTLNTKEIERLFQICSHGTCDIVFETEKNWQLHFEIIVSGDVVEIMVFCLRAQSSYLEEMGYKGFAGPDGESSAIIGN